MLESNIWFWIIFSISANSAYRIVRMLDVLLHVSQLLQYLNFHTPPSALAGHALREFSWLASLSVHLQAKRQQNQSISKTSSCVASYKCHIPSCVTTPDFQCWWRKIMLYYLALLVTLWPSMNSSVSICFYSFCHNVQCSSCTIETSITMVFSVNETTSDICCSLYFEN